MINIIFKQKENKMLKKENEQLKRQINLLHKEKDNLIAFNTDLKMHIIEIENQIPKYRKGVK